MLRGLPLGPSRGESGFEFCRIAARIDQLTLGVDAPVGSGLGFAEAACQVVALAVGVAQAAVQRSDFRL